MIKWLRQQWRFWIYGEDPHPTEPPILFTSYRLKFLRDKDFRPTAIHYNPVYVKQFGVYQPDFHNNDDVYYIPLSLCDGSSLFYPNTSAYINTIMIDRKKGEIEHIRRQRDIDFDCDYWSPVKKFSYQGTKESILKECIDMARNKEITADDIFMMFEKKMLSIRYEKIKKIKRTLKINV